MAENKINKELLKGSVATLALKGLSRREMYGYELIKEIEKVSEGAITFKEGTLYPILHALESDGSIQSRWEESEEGRKRKYYKLTEKGRKILQEKRSEWKAFRNAVDQVLQGSRGAEAGA
jgi:PadR family transcriptional regulator, regulatory protein PadR